MPSSPDSLADRLPARAGHRPADLAAWWILGSNALAILAAMRDDAGLLFLLWVFWIQSVVIGWYSRRRMLALKRFSTAGLLINDQPVQPTPETQRRTANFFALHYGGFHLAYLAFLFSGDARRGGGGLTGADWAFLALAAVSFWYSHRASHRENVEADLSRLPNIGSLMFLPYARVVPMHLAIGLGVKVGGEGALLGFGLLKTAADLLMHKVEHRWLQGARKLPARRTDTAGGRSSGSIALVLATLGAVAGLPAVLPGQSRELAWPSVSVSAHLDSAGRLHVAERQVMRFTGDWNGGEREFDVMLGQEFALRRLARVDPGTGALRDLRLDDDLRQVDDFAWPEVTTLRWRSRMPSDPPFDRAELTYLIEVEYGNIVVPRDDGTFRLSHDFGFSDRAGPIERFDLALTLDPAWRAPEGFTGTWMATDLPPGRGFVVTVPLTFTGTGRPGAVLYGTELRTRRTITSALAAAVVVVLVLLIIREARLGRFAPLPAREEITKEWLDAHVFSRLPEVIGAAWDDHTAAPEVAATLARLVQEGKLSSSVRTDAVWVFKKQVLELRLEVPRAKLQGHERTLVDALFQDHEQSTDTERVRERYKSSGFDPAALIRSRLTELVELTTPGAKGVKPSARVTLALVLAAFALLAVGLRGRSVDLPVIFGTIGASFPAFFLASIFAAIWRQRAGGPATHATLGVLTFAPLAAVIGAFGVAILGEDRFRTAPLIIAGLTMWLFALVNSVSNSAKSRHSAERIALRKRLTAARRVLREELAKPQPALRDEWFPYLIAFGLGKHVDRWFQAFGGTASATSASALSATSASAGSSGGGSGRSWSGFGGGGGFSGGGSSAGFAAAVGGMAASVPAPSSSSSGGGGGGGGGGSSGGGGGGGW